MRSISFSFKSTARIESEEDTTAKERKKKKKLFAHSHKAHSHKLYCKKTKSHD